MSAKDRPRAATAALRRLIVACDALTHEPSQAEIEELALASGESVKVVHTILETRTERMVNRSWPIGGRHRGRRWMPGEDDLLRVAWRTTRRASESQLAELDVRLAKLLTALAENRERGVERTPQQVRERRRWAWWLRPI